MRTTILIFMGLFCACFVQAQTVAIPDQQFYDVLIAASVDLDNDGFIQVSEAEMVDTLKVNESNISDLTGIAAFKNITFLDCSGNELQSIDLSNNKALKTLNCGFNQISTLNTSQNTQLRILDCGTNPLKKLDVSKNVKLDELHCFYNELNSLDVSLNVLLRILRCDGNNIKSLDVSKNAALTNLSCPDNQLVALDVSHNKELQSLDCYNNGILQMDFTENSQLIYLQCFNNGLRSLNVSKNTALQSLVCTSNPSLKVICVWNVAEVEKKSQFQKDPSAIWADTCRNFTSVDDVVNTDSYRVYPNPAEDMLYMSPLVQKAVFYNVIGAPVMSSVPTGATVDVSDLSTGIYTVKLTYADGHSSCQRVLKK